MALLQQVFGDFPFPTHVVVEPSTTIGRHEDCEVLMEAPAVSRFHAKITKEKDDFFLEDLGSRNGTLLNGKLIQSRTKLRDGDQIEICTLPFTFLAEQSHSEKSGSSVRQPHVICLSPTGAESEDSVRRETVKPGDRLTAGQMGSDAIRASQMVSTLRIGDRGYGWPVTQDAAGKLNHTLRLQHQYRGVSTSAELLAKTLEFLFEVFENVDRIVVVLRDPDTGDVHIGTAGSRLTDDRVEIGLPLVRTAIQSLEALLYIDNQRMDCGEVEPVADQNQRSIMVCPFVDADGVCIGALQLDGTSRHHPLRPADLETLVVLGSVLGCHLEQLAVFEGQMERAVLDRSAADARRLQLQLTPNSFPEVRGYRLSHQILASEDVAADLVDYVRLPGGRVACLLIDVPGRGSEAVALMALLSRILTEAISESGCPAAALQAAGDHLQLRLASIPTAISVAIVVLDPQKSLVTMAVAGHCQVISVRQTTVHELDLSDFAASPLGVEPAEFSTHEYSLFDDDVILICSDGVRAITSPTGTRLSSEAFQTMTETAARSHRSVFESKLESLLANYRGGACITDDAAFVMIHRTRDAETIDSCDSSGINSETIDA